MQYLVKKLVKRYNCLALISKGNSRKLFDAQGEKGLQTFCKVLLDK